MTSRRQFLLGAPAAVFAAQSITGGAQDGGFEIAGSGLVFAFEVTQGKLRQSYLLPAGIRPDAPLPAPSDASGLEAAIHCSGENQQDHHGLKVTGSMPGGRLVFAEKREEDTAMGKHVVLTQRDPVLGLRVESHYEFFHEAPAVRRFTRVANEGAAPVGIEYVSSAMVHNFGNLGPRALDDKLRIHFAYSSWKSEGQWHSVRPSSVGFVDNGEFDLSAAFFSNVGSWSSMRYLPMGMVENADAGVIWFWQIEHSGSWHWEISNTSKRATYLYAGGPDEPHAQAWKRLMPGQSYDTVPVALGCVRGGFEEAVSALTRYRRAACLRPHRDNRQCPVIFNDYMNCLTGNPTTEKELPLIDAAAEAGCEYFVIDAGWYAEQNETWWDSVGIWQPSKTRWSGGLQNVLARIRSRGMVPGLWLEIEVAGIRSPLRDKPDAWFLQRHGRRVIENSRYLLDFRNPEVRADADEVVDRLVRSYGAGYLKMDFNVNAGVGTEFRADSFGQGLLEHQRAYLGWLDRAHDRYAELVIENCASGGGRMDYAMLSRFQLQSSSDQTDYRKYPAIVPGAMAGVLPEQLAVWSYPLSEGNADEASCNMVNAMLCRIHQSGHLAKLKPESLAQVKTGIRVYKERIRGMIPAATPFFPLGLPGITDAGSPIALGLRHSEKTLLAVWRLGGGDEVTVRGIPPDAELIYPADLGIRIQAREGNLTVRFPRAHMAALIQASPTHAGPRKSG
jgi:alpha-galactosidase